MALLSSPFDTPKLSSLGHAKHRRRKRVNRKERAGHKCSVFRTSKGHKGVSLHALVSMRASGRPEVAEMLTWLLALDSPSTTLQSAELLRNLRVQHKSSFSQPHSNEGQITGLADTQAPLSRAAAASAPLKQSNSVVKNLVQRKALNEPTLAP